MAASIRLRGWRRIGTWASLGALAAAVALTASQARAQELPEASSQSTPSPAARVDPATQPVPQTLPAAPTSAQQSTTTAPAASSSPTTAPEQPPLNSSGAYVFGGTTPPPKPAAANVPVAAATKRLPDPSPAEIDHIIDSFTKQERLFRTMLENNYMYTETIDVELTDDSYNPIGQSYRQTNEIDYTPDHHKEIVCTYCPEPTLRDVTITEDDINDFFNMDMYTIDVDNIGEYNVTYVDHEPLDEITAYRFDVAPKQIEKGKRYFEGHIWVDDRDLMIVKTYGKAVPNQYDRHGNPTNVFLPFETWRQLIDGKYWFPVYTRTEDKLPPMNGGVTETPLKIVIQFSNYKEFRGTARIVSVGTVPPSGTSTTPQIGPDGKPIPATAAKPGGTGH